jgi:hypothetical protein
MAMAVDHLLQILQLHIPDISEIRLPMLSVGPTACAILPVLVGFFMGPH